MVLPVGSRREQQGAASRNGRFLKKAPASFSLKLSPPSKPQLSAFCSARPAERRSSPEYTSWKLAAACQIVVIWYKTPGDILNGRSLTDIWKQNLCLYLGLLNENFPIKRKPSGQKMKTQRKMRIVPEPAAANTCAQVLMEEVTWLAQLLPDVGFQRNMFEVGH